MVGLFVDADDAVIADALVATKLNALQLHGSESPERVAQLRAVWQAGVKAPRRQQRCRTRRSLCGAADLILFDAKTPKARCPAYGVGVPAGRCWPDIAVPCRGGWQAG